MKEHERLCGMPIDPDVALLQHLDQALRQVSHELDAAWSRRRVVTERATALWRGGDCRAFAERSAQLDAVTRRTQSDLAVVRRAVRAALQGFADGDGAAR